MVEPIPYDRDKFLAQWSVMLKCENTPFAIAAELVNKAKNFQTAVHVLFGLSWRTHAPYAKKCADYWREIWPKDGVCTAQWCIEFQNHYITEKEAYPHDA